MWQVESENPLHLFNKTKATVPTTRTIYKKYTSSYLIKVQPGQVK